MAKRRSPAHPAVEAYVSARIRKLSDYLALNKETHILDVGCGNGFFTFHFDKICDCTGVDYSKKMLTLNPVEGCVCADAGNLCFKEDSFDAVFCHALLHHVDNMDDVLSEMKRVSRKHVVVLEPNRNNPLMALFSLIVAEERKALKFSLGYLKRKVRKSGLHITSAFSFGLSVPNKMPVFLIPFSKLFDFTQPLGMTNVVLAEKRSD